MANPRVFFDVSIGGKRAGRLLFELFQDAVRAGGAAGEGWAVRADLEWTWAKRGINTH